MGTETMQNAAAGKTGTVVGPVVLLGAPGAGKGTQAQRITDYFGIPQISTGDILRDNIRRGTELGVQAKAQMEQGKLVDDQIVCGMVADRIAQPDCKTGFILDGFPRTVKQAQWLDRHLQQMRYFETERGCLKQPIVIQLTVEYNDLLRRLTGRRTCPTCGRIYNAYTNLKPLVEDICDVDGAALTTRKDDREDVIAERLKNYEDQTLPLVGYYSMRKRLIEVDGSAADVDVITSQVRKAIENADCL
jgi:adenylate kinase